MERKVLLLGLLQSLSLFAFAHSDFNRTSMDNSIDTDMTGIEEYIRTLHPVESPLVNAAFSSGEERENLLPFGALKTDWARLHLLHDALPQESVLKQKFKNLVRLLLIASVQATRLASSSESTKTQDGVDSETTLSVSAKEEGIVQEIDKQMTIAEHETLLKSTGQSQEIGATLKEFSNTASSVDSHDETLSTLRSGVSNLVTPSPKYAEEGVDTVVTKNISQYSTERVDGEKTTALPDFTDAGAPIELSTILAAPVVTLGTGEPCSHCTDDLDDLSINMTTPITAEPRESSLSVLTTPGSDEEIISNSKHEDVLGSVPANYSSATGTISLSENEPVENETNSTGRGSNGIGIESFTFIDTNVGSSTETIIKEEFEQSSAREEYFSAETLSNATTTVEGDSTSSTPSGGDSTSSTPSGGDSEWTKEEAEDTSSYKPSSETVRMEAADEYSLAATVSNSVYSPSQLLSSTSRENFAISTETENDVGSPAQSAVTTRPEKRYTIREDFSSAATVLSYERTKAPSFTSTRKEEQLFVSTEEESLLAVLATTASPVETSEKSKSPLSVRNITSDGVKEEESLLSETQSQSILEVKPTTERVGSSIEKFSSTSSSAKVYTDANLWLTMDSAENASIDKAWDNELTKLTSLDDEIEYVTSEKSVGTKQQGASSSTPGSTSASDSPTVSTKTTRYDERSTTIFVAKEADLQRDGQHINNSDKLTDELGTEKITVNHRVQKNTGSTTEETTGTRKVTDKPRYIKNPLDVGSSRSNHIFKDFKHGSDNVGTNQSPESEKIILYESGGGAKSGGVWKPHLVGERPVGNSIWRFDKFPENVKAYGYQRSSPSAVTNANFDGESKSSARWPFQSRTNVLRSRKRGSANADVAKQFRSFYRQGRIDPSNKSRSDGNDHTKIKIQCKNAQ